MDGASPPRPPLLPSIPVLPFNSSNMDSVPEDDVALMLQDWDID